MLHDDTRRLSAGLMTQDNLNEIAELHKRFMNGQSGGRRAMLRREDLSGLSLKGRDMRQADLSGCDMTGMDLSGANFREASLYACNLTKADLNGTCFVRADMRGCKIENADLENADLDSADLRAGGLAEEGAFSGKENNVNFRGADLAGARLSGTLAVHADFSDAIMSKVDLSGADLSNAQFEGADLTEAEIKGARFGGANMRSAILTGVELEEIRKSGVSLDETITDENVGDSLEKLDAPLPQKIREHRAWVSSMGKEGRQLDLSGFDLRALLSLAGEKLTALRAVGSRWCGMDMTDIHLQSSILDGADFRSCF